MSKCQRCGLCCQNCGDIGDDAQTDSGPCSCLSFENGLAVCWIQKEWGYGMKPEVCQAYPFPDIDGGKCHRELAQEKAGEFV